MTVTVHRHCNLGATRMYMNENKKTLLIRATYSNHEIKKKKKTNGNEISICPPRLICVVPHRRRSLYFQEMYG